MINYSQFAAHLYATLIDIEYYVSGQKYPVDDINYYDFEFHQYNSYKHTGVPAEEQKLLKDYTKELIESLSNKTPIPRLFLDCNDSSLLNGDINIIESFLTHIKDPDLRKEVYEKVFQHCSINNVLETLNRLKPEQQNDLVKLVFNYAKNQNPEIGIVGQIVSIKFNLKNSQHNFIDKYRDDILEILEKNYHLILEKDNEGYNISSLRERIENWVKINEKPFYWNQYKKFFPQSLYNEKNTQLFEEQLYSVYQMRINYQNIIENFEFITNYKTVDMFLDCAIDVINSEIKNFTGINNIIQLSTTKTSQDIGLLLEDNTKKEENIQFFKKIVEEIFAYYNNSIYQEINVENKDLAKKALKTDFFSIILEVKTPDKSIVKQKKKI